MKIWNMPDSNRKVSALLNHPTEALINDSVLINLLAFGRSADFIFQIQSTTCFWYLSTLKWRSKSEPPRHHIHTRDAFFLLNYSTLERHNSLELFSRGYESRAFPVTPKARCPLIGRNGAKDQTRTGVIESAIQGTSRCTTFAWLGK